MSQIRKLSERSSGESLFRVFEDAQKQLIAEAGEAGATIDFLVQGTLYPDVVESGGGQELPQSRAITTLVAFLMTLNSNFASHFGNCLRMKFGQLVAN
jgi:3-oxoacyl-[acyl-carrier-protein] synthase III